MILLKRDDIKNLNIPVNYNLFNASNYKAPKIYSEMKAVLVDFNRIFPSVQDFIVSKEAKYRDILVKHLSVQEEMYIKNILKEDTDKVINDAIICKSIRVFLVDANFDFKLLFYDTLEYNIISIFIGNKFYEDDSNHVKLIHEIVTNLLDKILRLYNIPIESNHKYDYLVIKDFYNPSNVEFVFQYYRFLLWAIINNTGKTVDFKYLQDHMLYYKAHLAFSNKSMQVLWDMVEDDLLGNVSDHAFKNVLISIHGVELEG
jgi:hypothetical protein